LKKDSIVIRGAREHNLKNIDLEIPHDKLVVFTGLSGSGKSSLAFDTIFADGQRRYIESLSSYARMFLGEMKKPDVDSIEGLSPAISIDQKSTSNNPRSTVGTVTEISDYMRLLFARVGIPHCPICGRVIKQQSVDQIVDSIKELPEGTRFMILAPIVRGKKGEHKKELASAQASGFVRARVDGNIYDLSETISLDKNVKHNIEIVVDRLVMNPDVGGRLADSLETALGMADGIVIVSSDQGDRMYSQNYACPEHGISVDELTPRMFSFNSPIGACPECAGLGYFRHVDPDLVVPDPTKSIKGGAVRGSGWNYTDNSIAKMYFDALARHYKFSLDKPWKDLPEKARNVILFGTNGEKLELYRENQFGYASYKGEFEGVVNNLERRYKESTSDWAKADIEPYMSSVTCRSCGGRRLNKTALAVTVGGKNIMDIGDLSVEKALDFFQNLKLEGSDEIIGRGLIKEIISRLNFLNNVGLSYLTLNRSATTLSGGESQRIRLATQIGSQLSGVLYVLDEPSIGLHQRDNRKLIDALKDLRDLGNTLIVVEHDEETIRSADYVVDIGPGAGVNGGKVVYAGDVDGLLKCPESLTGAYLSGKRQIIVPAERRKGNGKFLTVRGAAQNNLKNIDVSFPLGTFTCVTGVSGSGKSSLVNDILYNRLATVLNGARIPAGKHDSIEGTEYLDKIIGIDQSPIGRTPRSNPATYIGLFTYIRELFASTNDAKVRGYQSRRFSFNIKGGRCEACEGAGIIKVEMQFLPDVYVPCEVCHGRRYNRETLEVKYKGKSIYDVLEMTVEEALQFFRNIPRIYRKIKTLYDVGLGYIKLGQPATTLSGGEAQRVKLAAELSRQSTGKTLYVLDEPTTGLHTDDVSKLIAILQKLVDNGNTVIVIEHNLDVIKTADYIIDLGPEGGDEGGTIVAQGTPEEVSRNRKSYTGYYLKEILK
jgi:excinuclease ABC subunit A